MHCSKIGATPSSLNRLLAAALLSFSLGMMTACNKAKSVAEPATSSTQAAAVKTQKAPTPPPTKQPSEVAQAETPTKADLKTVMAKLKLKEGDRLLVTFETSEGNLQGELYWDKVPNTVLNFVELAQGTREWTDPKTNQKVKRPLYDGTVFHRVIPKFMIQGGDPKGTGQGGPGYKFEDEFHASLKHDGPGIISMANAGPNTNGSQFFITDKATPHLNNRHSVFGKVDEASLAIVSKIANVEKDRPGSSKPKTPVVLNKVSIERKAK